MADELGGGITNQNLRDWEQLYAARGWAALEIAVTMIIGSTAMKSLVISLALLIASPALGGEKVLKHEPPEGALRTGKRVLVDDGTCPPGQLLQVIGGSRTPRSPRQRVCVPRART